MCNVNTMREMAMCVQCVYYSILMCVSIIIETVWKYNVCNVSMNNVSNVSVY